MDKNSYYLKFINQALEIAKAIPKYFSKFSKKIFNNHQKLILLVLKQKLRTTYRDLIEILRITDIPNLIKLKRLPHFTTLIKFSKKLSPLLVRKLLAYSCKISKPSRLKLGIDETGFSVEQRSEHYATIVGRRRKVIQINACALLDKQLISTFRVRKVKQVYSEKLIPLLMESKELGYVDYVCADKGYDGEKNHSYIIRELKARSCIAVRQRFSKNPGRATLRKRIALNFDKETYHQRSKVETIFSVIKRKYGSCLKGKNYITQQRELLQKILTCNIDRLTKIIQQIILGCHQSLWARVCRTIR